MMQLFLRKTLKSLVKYCKLAAALLPLLLITLSGCAPEKTADETAIDTGAICIVSDYSPKMTGNTLQSFTYSWKNTEKIVNLKNLMAKVHFTNSDGKILFQDDHALFPDLMNKAYTREILIPLIPKTQTITVKVGLFIPGKSDRFLIQNAEAVTGKKISTASILVSPPRNLDDLPEARITFGNGWYEKEYGKGIADSWRWMGPVSECQLKGADRDLILYIRGWIPPENLKENMTISLALNGDDIGTTSPLKDNFIIKRMISANLIPDGEFASLSLSCSSSYKPSDYGHEDDSRDLSVMIKDIYFN